MDKQTNKPYSGPVVFTADTFIDGEHTPAGTVRTISATNYALLREANRCEIFDGANAAHQTCLAASRKLDAARKDAEAKAQKVAEDAQTPGASPEAQAAAKKAEAAVAKLDKK